MVGPLPARLLFVRSASCSSSAGSGGGRSLISSSPPSSMMSLTVGSTSRSEFRQVNSSHFSRPGGAAGSSWCPASARRRPSARHRSACDRPSGSVPRLATGPPWPATAPGRSRPRRSRRPPVRHGRQMASMASCTYGSLAWIRDAASFVLNSIRRSRTRDTSSPASPRCKRPRRERRHRQRLDVLVEGGVVMLERLVVRQVTGPGPIEDRADQARRVRVPPDPAGGLDVLGGRLRLAGDDHQAQPPHVHAHRDPLMGPSRWIALSGGLPGG